MIYKFVHFFWRKVIYNVPRVNKLTSLVVGGVDLWLDSPDPERVESFVLLHFRNNYITTFQMCTSCIIVSVLL